MQQSLEFLSALRENNNREWFHAHKKAYEAARQEFEALIGRLLADMAPWEPAVRSLEPKDCLFRLYRDVRFSKDKTPYKLHFGAYLAEGGRKSEKAGYYLHVRPGDRSFVGGGLWEPGAEGLRNVRQEIDYNGKELHTILEEPAFASHYAALEGEKLQRPPKGYDASHPDVEILKQKSFFVSHNLTDVQVGADGLEKRILRAWQALKPLNDFLNRGLEG
ncbi:TIGR02453 family protein [Catalinimonas alkaloidigena]|uniref:TIGR02453 family protein n=1 Tax=Catalinimonas alkaloidigena TaxID=1075417 RepID=A0A1G8WJK6_9BACT|nr:DUF2461 domain-containing protein [Catalinimonas alkaloidigena]SDJ78307.1 TIGR02453 family protein [Catalinimonas alkaloidigena]